MIVSEIVCTNPERSGYEDVCVERGECGETRQLRQRLEIAAREKSRASDAFLRNQPVVNIRPFEEVVVKRNDFQIAPRHGAAQVAAMCRSQARGRERSVYDEMSLERSANVEGRL
jgi:hypothetical protein